MLTDLHIFHLILFHFNCLCYFAIKDANYKSPWNILVISHHRKMMPDLKLSQAEMSDFVSFLLFGFTESKTEKFWFWKPLKYLNGFRLRKIWLQTFFKKKFLKPIAWNLTEWKHVGTIIYVTLLTVKPINLERFYQRKHI